MAIRLHKPREARVMSEVEGSTRQKQPQVRMETDFVDQLVEHFPQFGVPTRNDAHRVQLIDDQHSPLSLAESSQHHRRRIGQIQRSTQGGSSGERREVVESDRKERDIALLELVDDMGQNTALAHSSRADHEMRERAVIRQ